VPVLAGLFAVFCLLSTTASAQLQTQLIVSGLSEPVAFVHDPLAANTFYIVEQGGLVKVLVDGQLQVEPFIDLRSAVASGGERGLFGMAFGADGRVFFNFTNTDGHTVIARFRRDVASPRRANPSSRFDLVWPGGERFIRQPFANHNGGHLEFGPDGMLYIGLGDGGSGNDPFNLAQDPASLLGKMLRIDVRVGDNDPIGYRIPQDNPFVDGQPLAALGEIWSFGLRNPWRYSFDSVGPGATGTLFIGDVGQGAREEINAEPAGAGGRNYGWRIREGRIPTPGIPPTPPAFGPLVDPILEYPRTEGQAVTGGYVYRGSALGAAYQARYFFADFVTSRVWSLGLMRSGDGNVGVANVVEHTGELGGDLGGISSFARDRDGELYVLTFSGNVLKIVANAGPVPSAPQNLRATVIGQTVTLSWTPPSGAQAVTGYRLEAGAVSNASDLAIATTGPTATSVTFANVPPGTYYVRMRSLNGAGQSAPSNEVVVTVGGGGCARPPSAPSSLTAVVSGRTVTLTWLDASSGNAATHYVLEAGSTPGRADLAMFEVPGTQRSLMLQAPSGNYYVRIRGVNACGISEASNEFLVRVF
jgi:glucose/arabinose dehydrogenase